MSKVSTTHLYKKYLRIKLKTSFVGEKFNKKSQIMMKEALLLEYNFWEDVDTSYKSFPIFKFRIFGFSNEKKGTPHVLYLLFSKSVIF